MMQDKNMQDKNKIKLIKDIYSQALLDISKIKKERDNKIKKLLKTIDDRHVNEILNNIKNI